MSVVRLKSTNVSLLEVVPEKSQQSNKLATTIMMKSGDGTFVSMIHEYVSPEILFTYKCILQWV